MTGDRWLIVGLGNPGPGYAGNRHNAGYMVADELAARIGARFRAGKFQAAVAEGRLAGQPVTLAKPMTFMNLSGGPVAGLSGYYRVPASQLVVIHDELDLPFGTIRLKLGGGDNGHNGLRSVTTSLGTRDYYRIRFGIGRPPGRMDPAAFVLRDFSTAERKELPFLVDRSADATEALLTGGLAAAQNAFHAGAPQTDGDLGGARGPGGSGDAGDPADGSPPRD
jgi:peptidyl-tRNA hydrolase, PTH1 family